MSGQLLGHSLLVKEIDSGRITARPGKTRNQTDIDRVLDDAEDDRDVHCRGFRRKCRRGASSRCDYRNRPADAVGDQRWQAIILPVEPVVIDHDVLDVNRARFAQACAEHATIARGVVRRPATDEAARHRRLPRPRGKLPSSRASEPREEFAPSHLQSLNIGA
jgi:hypothetical protein